MSPKIPLNDKKTDHISFVLELKEAIKKATFKNAISILVLHHIFNKYDFSKGAGIVDDLNSFLKDVKVTSLSRKSGYKNRVKIIPSIF